MNPTVVVSKCFTNRRSRNAATWTLRFGHSFFRDQIRATSFQILGTSICYLATFLTVVAIKGADADAVPANPLVPGETTNVSVSTNYIQQFYEELLTTLRAAEKSRAESEATAKRNEELMGVRLSSIEQSLRDRFEHELAAIKTRNQFMITVVAVLGGFGGVGIFLAALILLRALNRVADVASAARTSSLIGVGHQISVPSVSRGASLAEESSAQVLKAIDRIQQRIDYLERPAILNLKPTEEAKHIISAKQSNAPVVPKEIELLLGKAQALIQLNQTEAALACLEEVLAVDASNVDALIERGTALERLGRIDEAIGGYNRAIALNPQSTTAYLLKGGMFNRLGRHREAVQCFEQALLAREKRTR